VQMSEQAVRDRVAGSSAWVVQRQLGRGQYGTAYLVEWGGKNPDGSQVDYNNSTEVQRNVGEEAVAKVVGLEFLPEKEHTLAFQEVELMRKLRHPHIVSLVDHFLTEAGLELCIVMNFCDSGDLRGEVKRRSVAKPPSMIPEAQVMAWFVQLTLALNYIHARHILHRDLKSSNIFLHADSSPEKSHSGNYDLRIGDFGIARVLEGTVDVAATVVGTPYYMSPEVCKSEPYGYKSDIWALGCVLYEMCMLKHAFESQSLLGLVYKIVSETYDPIPPQYSNDQRSLMERVLDKSSYTRYSGKEIVSDPYVKRFVDLVGQTSCGGAPSTFTTPAAPSAPATVTYGTAAQAASPAPAPPDSGIQGTPGKPPPKTSLAGRTPASGASPGPWRQPNFGGPVARAPEPAPLPPDVAPQGRMGGMGPATQEEPAQRRQWCAPSGAAPAGAAPVDEGQLRMQVLMRRINLALAKGRQNWLQVFATFDRAGNGQLTEAQFEQALTSMALGLSDAEIRELRARLTGGSGACVDVNRFASALHQTPKDVLRLEEWARSVMAELATAASQSNRDEAVAPGAQVRVQGLQSASGKMLNGCEGVVDKWDPTTCRWFVKLHGDVTKSIRDENLLVLRPGVAPAGTQETAGLYRMLCQGGDQAVPEERFLSVVQRLLPSLTEAERRKLVPLLPKTQEGGIDAPEALAQFAGGNQLDQTRMAGPPLPGAASPAPTRRTAPSPMLSPPVPTMASTAGGGGFRPSPPGGLPGSVSSPRGPGRPMPLGAFGAGPGPGGGGSSSSTAPVNAGPPVGQDRVRAEVALLRLAQRLMGVHASVPGPGVDVLRLFASPTHIDEVRLDDLLDAASVLPLGISRAEVQSVFFHIRGQAGTPSAVPFSALASAAEAALSAGQPAEAGVIDQLDASRLTRALHQLGSIGGGRSSPQDFRFALMQAEPYLTPGQLEWLMMLTDKDGEGRLLPKSLLARLGNPQQQRMIGGTGGGPALVLVPPRPPGSSQGPVARSVGRDVVVNAALARVRDRLRLAKPDGGLKLQAVLGLFELDGESRMSRATLATVMGHLRLGLSAGEADEVVNSLGGNHSSSGNLSAANTVAIASLCEALARASDAAREASTTEMREGAKEFLSGRGDALASAAMQGYPDSEWLSEVDFRRVLVSTSTAAGLPKLELEEDMLDTLLLLAEKNAAGELRWRHFAKSYMGWDEPDALNDSWGSPRHICASPIGKRTLFGATPVRLDTGVGQNPQSMTAQSWRSAKLQEASRTQSVPYSPDKEPLSEEPPLPASPAGGNPPSKCGCCIS